MQKGNLVPVRKQEADPSRSLKNVLLLMCNLQLLKQSVVTLKVQST